MLFSQVRARMQLSDSGGLCSRGGASIRSPLHAMELVVRKEGAVALWRSLPEAVVYNAVLNSVRFSLYSALTVSAAQSSHMEALPKPVGGFVAGCIAGAIASPIAKARTAAQRGPTDSRSSALVDTIRHRPFSGASSWALRNGGHTGIIFSTYEGLNRGFSTSLSGLPPISHSLLASLCAATISCVLMNPLDVISTRVFAQSSPQPALAGARSFGPAGFAPLGCCTGLCMPMPATAHYSSPVDCAVKLVASEGVAALWKGLGANLARIVPHTAVTFAIVESLRPRLARS